MSVNILAPSYSLICGMTLTQVFKIIYPLLFAMVPLGLFEIFKKQINNKSAFLGAFLFMSISTFYYDMISLARQQTAELFLMLLLLVVLNNMHRRMIKSILFLIFGQIIHINLQQEQLTQFINLIVLILKLLIEQL